MTERGETMGKKVSLAICIAVLAWAGLGPEQAWAQEEKLFPTRALTYMNVFEPGGPADRLLRMQQPELERLFKQRVLSDYKVGGGGALGWRELAKSKPDGYTFAVMSLPHIVLQPLQQDVGYKTEQIVPIAIFANDPIAVTVLPGSQFKTLAELLDYARKNPGALTIGGVGTFTPYHIAILRFEKLTGVKLTYVPFTGSATQIMSFLGGHTAATLGASSDMVRYKDKIRVLAFATEERMPDFPDSPTLKELGFDLAAGVDRGVAVPPGTPEYAVKKLEAAFLEISRNPEFQANVKGMGYMLKTVGHEESKSYIAKLTDIYKDLLKK